MAALFKSFLTWEDIRQLTIKGTITSKLTNGEPNFHEEELELILK